MSWRHTAELTLPTKHRTNGIVVVALIPFQTATAAAPSNVPSLSACECASFKGGGGLHCLLFLLFFNIYLTLTTPTAREQLPYMTTLSQIETLTCWQLFSSEVNSHCSHCIQSTHDAAIGEYYWRTLHLADVTAATEEPDSSLHQCTDTHSPPSCSRS